MARRKSGKELVEIFKELSTGEAPEATRKIPLYQGQERPSAAREDVHRIRLGERRQVEVAMSMGWVYGVIFFAVLLLFGAFAVGRQFAPPPGPIDAVEPGDSFVREAERVGEVTRVETPAEVVRPAPTPARAGEVPSPPEAEREAPGTAEAPPMAVSEGKMYTLRVITYDKGRTPESRDVRETLEFLKANGLPEVRTYIKTSSGQLIVVVGSFDTTTSDDAKSAFRQVRGLEFKGKKQFSGAYFTSLRGFQ